MAFGAFLCNRYQIPCGLIVVTFLKGKATLIITIFYMKDLNKP